MGVYNFLQRAVELAMSPFFFPDHTSPHNIIQSYLDSHRQNTKFKESADKDYHKCAIQFPFSISLKKAYVGGWKEFKSNWNCVGGNWGSKSKTEKYEKQSRARQNRYYLDMLFILGHFLLTFFLCMKKMEGIGLNLRLIILKEDIISQIPGKHNKSRFSWLILCLTFSKIAGNIEKNETTAGYMHVKSTHLNFHGHPWQ